MLTVLYRVLVLLLLAAVIRCVLTERKLRNQVAFGLVLIPLVLRVLMLR